MLVCIQRNIVDMYNNKFEPQEINIEKMRVIRNNYLKDKEVFSTVCNNEDIVINGLGFIKVVNTAKIDIYVVNKNILSKRERLI